MENAVRPNKQKANPVKEKSYLFAVHIVKFCKTLQHVHKEFVLSKQLLRSGTSVGANIEEAQQAQSKKDFISKMSIALKEANESRYWLKLIKEAVNGIEEAQNLIQELEEVQYLLIAIIKKSKEHR